MQPAIGIQSGLQNSISKDFGSRQFKKIAQKYLYSQSFILILIMIYYLLSLNIKSILLTLG
jgi:hypothetical protein